MVDYLRQSLSEVERKVILKALRKTGWIKRDAAKVLGISRSTLYRKLNRYRIRSEYQEQLDKLLPRN
ncbi:MAG TPA: hypothetical protein EYP60_02480 [bacterium (Candidatus Stahlbacteria)]|nr:hypothetical protein [Candidatus Stahlbacteria bacterium]